MTSDSIPQQAGALAKAIREDGCCHHWKDAVRFLDHLAAPSSGRTSVDAAPDAPSAKHPPRVTNGMAQHLAASVEELAAVSVQLQEIEAKYGLYSVPDGFALVPIEPTPEMVAAMSMVEASGVHDGVRCVGIAGACEAFDAMLVAASRHLAKRSKRRRAFGSPARPGRGQMNQKESHDRT